VSDDIVVGDRVRVSFGRRGRWVQTPTELEGTVIGYGVDEWGQQTVIAHWSSRAVPGAQFRMGMVVSRVQKVTEES
jgi:hypothetical protein